MNIHQKIYGEEYAAAIPPILHQCRTGRVHSVFQNGCNLRFGDHLVFIGSVKNGRLPFGIHFSVDQVQQMMRIVQRNELVHFQSENETLYFQSSGCEIILKSAQIFSNPIPIGFMDQRQSLWHVRSFFTSIIKSGKQNGFDMDLARFLLREYKQSDSSFEIVRKMYKLQEKLDSNDPAAIEEILRFFIGRGKGLTPTGDDMLIGILAIHALTGRVTSTFINKLKQLVYHSQLTTDVSKTYLQYALKGQFSDTITDILYVFSRSNIGNVDFLIEKLLQTGHTSGVDTAIGMCLALMK
ncbi:oxamate carbamoyltransferase subunit AllH family protein [Bacillus chungangensis]|uniref:DUF2877 domain-containing protein n=1 Tax=Bacillus chungangensis TaxID=587633 RepID=A0ABT9WQC8_9BACI|nr:DUF2877 domain-containing protein [Bacillus chungangensis]MDQ0175415.1 hypothetical protein [Bacillus chungangensis]